MRLLLISHGFEGNYVIGFARGLDANKVPLLVVSDDAIASRLDLAGISHVNLRGSLDPARTSAKKLANLLRYYLRLFLIVFQHRGQPVHFCGLLASRYILFEGLILPVWLRIWAGRYIHTAHNVLPHGRQGQRLFREIYRWIYRFPHTIVAHTEKVRAQLVAEYSVAPERVEVISIGLNEEVSPTPLSQSEARKRLGLDGTERLVLFFGKVEPYKGVDTLAAAWPLVHTPRARLIIAGLAPDPSFAQTVREAVARCGPSAAIQWREGFLPNDEVALWLAACDVVVMPYRHIYQSGVVFLCLNLGVPIVATPVGSLAEYLADGNGLMAQGSSPADIAAAIDEFFRQQGEFDRKAIAARVQKYHWNRQCAAIRHLYR